MYSKTYSKRLLKKDRQLVFKTDYRLMQVKCIAESAKRSTFIKLPFVIKIIVWSIFEWPLKTGFAIYKSKQNSQVIGNGITPSDFYLFLSSPL